MRINVKKALEKVVEPVLFSLGFKYNEKESHPKHRYYTYSKIIYGQERYINFFMLPPTVCIMRGISPKTIFVKCIAQYNPELVLRHIGRFPFIEKGWSYTTQEDLEKNLKEIMDWLLKVGIPWLEQEKPEQPKYGE
jgi:hypothetical protein